MKIKICIYILTCVMIFEFSLYVQVFLNGEHADSQDIILCCCFISFSVIMI